MLLDIDTMSVEEVDIFVTEVDAYDKEEEVDKVEEATSEEVAEGEPAHTKTELIYQMSPVTLKIQSGPHPQMIQGRTSLRTQSEQSSWKIRRGAPPALSVLKRIMRIG